MRKNLKLGSVLIENGFITEEQLEIAIQMQNKSKNKKLGDILIDLDFVDEETIAECLAQQLDIPFVKVSSLEIDPLAVSLIDPIYSQRNNVLAVGFGEDLLNVITSDPLNYNVFEEIKSITGYEISVTIVTGIDINDLFEKLFVDMKVRDAVESFDERNSESKFNEFQNADEKIDGTPLIKLLNTIILQAAKSNASDIHIEPTGTKLEIRMRINGDLIHYTNMSLSAHIPIVTRLKLMSEVDIAEKRIPQDGRYNFKSEGYEIDIRTSTLPTIYGEKVVLRLLGNNKQNNLKNLEDLGMDSCSLASFKKIMKAPNGIILVTGPTGSGKSTTLYAALNLLSKKNVNIVTIEDPVEQRMERINQVQVNVKAGLTFASALRSILRQDPDIIMVGEMRDEETASLAMRGAITGHLVLSTLHTNDSIAAIPRMIDMGVPNYMVSAALTGIVAQRLVKILCPHCKSKREVKRGDILLKSTDVTTVFEPVGCKYCNNTGFVGRKPIYEIIDVDSCLRDMITAGSSVAEMKKYELSKETRFLGDKVLEMVRNGDTSVDEMERIVYSLEY